MQKVILITGASSEIGEGIARELGNAGAKVLLGARRLERIEAIAAEIRAGLLKHESWMSPVACRWRASCRTRWINGAASMC